MPPEAFTEDQLWLVFIQLPSLDGSMPEVEQRVVVAPTAPEGAVSCHALLGSYGQVIAVVSLPQLRQATQQSYAVAKTPHAWPAWFSPASTKYVVWLRGPQGLFAVKSQAASSAEALLGARLAHPDSALVLVGSAADGLEAVALLESIHRAQAWPQVNYDLRPGQSSVMLSVEGLSAAHQEFAAATQEWSQEERVEWERSHLAAMGVNPDEE